MRDQTRNKVKILALSLADLAFDIVVPTMVYFALRPFGVPLVLAVSTGGMVVAAKAGIGKIGGQDDPDAPNWAKPQRRDLLLVANTAVAIALMFALHAFGIALGVSCFRDKPGVLLASRPMAVAGDPKRAAFDAAWRNSTGFRTLMRGSTRFRTLMRGSTVELPLIILLVLYFLGFRLLAVPRATRFVEAEVA